MNPAFLTGKTAAHGALAILAVVAVLGIGVPIWSAFQAQREDIDGDLQQLGEIQAQIAARPQLETELAAINRRGASVPGIVEGDSTALAQAKLQSDLKGIIEGAKGQVRSMEALPGEQKGAFEMIAIECDLAIPQGRLKDLAYAVASHAPYLFVDQASISAPPSNPDEPQNRDILLDVRWTVHGYRWTGRR